MPPVVRAFRGDSQSSAATSAGGVAAAAISSGPGPRLAELMQGDDRSHAVAVEHRRDDLGGEAAVRVEHPPKGRIAVGRTAVVLYDLASLCSSSTTGCVRRSTVRSARSELTPHARASCVTGNA